MRYVIKVVDVPTNKRLSLISTPASNKEMTAEYILEALMDLSATTEMRVTLQTNDSFKIEASND